MSVTSSPLLRSLHLGLPSLKSPNWFPLTRQAPSRHSFRLLRIADRHQSAVGADEFSSSLPQLSHSMDLEVPPGGPPSPRRSLRRALTNKESLPMRLLMLYRNFIGDVIVFAGALAIFLVTEAASPRTNYIPNETLYRYSYPIKEQTVPSWEVVVIVFVAPSGCFLIYKIVRQRPWLEFYKLLAALVMSILVTAAVTNCIKVTIGRPRPNFIDSCWSSSAQVWENQDQYGGYPKCNTSASEYEEHMKSFPSGHSSVSAAGLGFLTYFLFGQTRAWSSTGNPWRATFSLLPALGALAIAVTRVFDYWHHPTDVIAGLILGFVIAYAMYRQLFPTWGHWDCHLPLYELQPRYTQVNRSTSATFISSGSVAQSNAV